MKEEEILSVHLFPCPICRDNLVKLIYNPLSILSDHKIKGITVIEGFWFVCHQCFHLFEVYDGKTENPMASIIGIMFNMKENEKIFSDWLNEAGKKVYDKEIPPIKFCVLLDDEIATMEVVSIDQCRRIK